MKRIAILFLTFLFFIISNKPLLSQNTIKFKINNIGNDSIMIAYYLGGKQYLLGNKGKNTYVKFDKNQTGFFKSNDLKKGLYMIVFPPKNSFVEFLFDGEDLDIYLDKNLMQETISFKNSKSNKLFYKYISHINGLKSKRENILKENSSDANKEEKINELEKKIDKYLNEIVSKNPNNMGAKFLKASRPIRVPESLKGQKERFNYYKANFFNHYNFNDEWLIRTPFFHSSITTYLDKLTLQTIDEIEKSIDYIINLSVNNDEMFKYLVITFLNKYAKNNLMIAENIYAYIIEKYYVTRKATWVSEKSLKKILDNYEAIKNSLIGKKIINFSLNYNLDSKQNFYDIQSEYKIVRFRKSDCKDCDLLNLKEITNTNVQVLDIIIGETAAKKYKFITSNPYKNPQIKKASLDYNEGQKILEFLNMKTSPTIFVFNKQNEIIAKKITFNQALGFISNDNN
ncbi:DUF5106 domain-containing protein [Polaribacter sp.]|uniref:DUF5106 domain-containing protein n=1 Tax=Polaribacter sp. TaxID=1920175 RepID=UPI003F6BEC08